MISSRFFTMAVHTVHTGLGAPRVPGAQIYCVLELVKELHLGTHKCTIFGKHPPFGGFLKYGYTLVQDFIIFRGFSMGFSM